MARYVESVCKLCRREGEKLFLKGDRCFSPKCAIERRGYRLLEELGIKPSVMYLADISNPAGGEDA